MPVSKEEFRRVMGHFLSGITVITFKGKDNTLRGITVSAFSSLSLDPPLFLICIDREASVYDHLAPGTQIAVNILAEDQEAVSRRFATRDSKHFEGLGYSPGINGAPLLADTLAYIEGNIIDACPGGDHTIFICEVLASGVHEGKPLAYYRGGYARLG